MSTHADQPFADAPSPEAYAIAPPEPFAQLMPGLIVMEGDIRLGLDHLGDGWNEVTQGYVGITVPDAQVAYARLIMPENFSRLVNGTFVHPRDQLWRSGEPRWVPVPAEWIARGMTVDGIREELAEEAQLYICRPDFDAPDHRVLPIPPHHRALAAAEPIRYGDKAIHAGLDDWQTVAVGLRGQECGEPCEPNKFVRYCRPIHPQAQNWYVDLRPDRGDDTGPGSAVTPFATLEGGQNAIEKASQDANITVYGVIWEVRGTPLVAYDLPEPQKQGYQAPILECDPAEEADRARLSALAPKIPIEPTGAAEKTAATPKLQKEHIKAMIQSLEQALLVAHTMLAEIESGE